MVMVEGSSSTERPNASIKRDKEVVQFLWELWYAGFRHSAGFHARVTLDGAACRLMYWVFSELLLLYRLLCVFLCHGRKSE